MIEKIESKVCKICHNQLLLNYTDEGPRSGICNNCGAMHTYELEDEEVKSEKVEFAVRFEVERELISKYYEQTGNKSLMITHVECSEKEKEEFLEWGRKNYPDLGWAEP